MRVTLALSLCLVEAAAAYAHGNDEHLHGGSALSPWDLAAVAMLAATGLLYALGTRRMHLRGARQPIHEPVAFVAGWGSLLVAVLPPLDARAVELFSAHMLQHELMMLVGAPLVMAGRPLSTCLWGVRDGWRPRLARVIQDRSVSSLWRIGTAPVVAWVLHGLAIWAWHMPALYDAAVRNEGVHALQHATFVGTSALFWWGLLYGRYGRAGYGAAVFYVFTTALHTGILGALLTLAGVPLYSVYLEQSGAAKALADQQTAGLLMWIPAGAVFTLLGVALFAAWLGESERRATRS